MNDFVLSIIFFIITLISLVIIIYYLSFSKKKISLILLIPWAFLSFSAIAGIYYSSNYFENLKLNSIQPKLNKIFNVKTNKEKIDKAYLYGLTFNKSIKTDKKIIFCSEKFKNFSLIKKCYNSQ